MKYCEYFFFFNILTFSKATTVSVSLPYFPLFQHFERNKIFDVYWINTRDHERNECALHTCGRREVSAIILDFTVQYHPHFSGMLHHQKRGHHPLENKAYITIATNRLIYRKLYACVGRRYFTDVHPRWKDHLPFGRRGCQSGESCISRRIWLSGTGIEYFRMDASPLS